MSIFNILNLIGGLSLFLFGMSLMGQALERWAGNRLKILLEKLTTNRITGLTTGLEMYNLFISEKRNLEYLFRGI